MSRNKKTKWIIPSVCMLLTSAVGIYAYYTAKDEMKTTLIVADEFLGDLVDEFVLLEHGIVDQNKDGFYELTDEEVLKNDYIVYPGVDIPKDPFVRYENLMGDAYLFVEVVGESTTEFQWSLRDCWKSTHLTGKHNGDVYVYQGQSTDAIELTPENNENFQEYILKEIDNSPNGGIVISDNFKVQETADLQFYSYLIQSRRFNNYEEAFAAVSGS